MSKKGHQKNFAYTSKMEVMTSKNGHFWMSSPVLSTFWKILALGTKCKAIMNLRNIYDLPKTKNFDCVGKGDLSPES